VNVSPQRRLVAELRFVSRLRALPPRVAWFHWRAHRLALRSADHFSLVSPTRPADLATLLKCAQGQRRVVELGTGTGWTALALALTDPLRKVVTYDPIYRPERESYLKLVASEVSSRIQFVTTEGSSGSADEATIDLLYIDSVHERQATIDEFRAWQPVLRDGALVVFDDYDHPDFPGVREATQALGLAGTQRGTLFIHEITSRPA
jgi:predicted O-methyltransferase YrrM